MDIFIYNVHKQIEFKNALNKAFVQKEVISGLNKSIECEVLAQSGAFLFKDVTLVDNEIILKVLNSFKTRYHIYFKIINLGVDLKFINITKDFKADPIPVTREVASDLSEAMTSGNFKDKNFKNDKPKKVVITELLNSLDNTSKLDLDNKENKVRNLGFLNGKRIITQIPDGTEIHVSDGKFTTNNDEYKSILIEKGFTENVSDPQ